MHNAFLEQPSSGPFIVKQSQINSKSLGANKPDDLKWVKVTYAWWKCLSFNKLHHVGIINFKLRVKVMTTGRMLYFMWVPKLWLLGGWYTSCQYQSYDYWEDDILHVSTKVMTTGRMIYFMSVPKLWLLGGWYTSCQYQSYDYWEDDILHVSTKAMTTGRMIYFMSVPKLWLMGGWYTRGSLITFYILTVNHM